VAGTDISLVSKSATLLALTATLFYVYDSLIEKCSTVSGSERQRGPHRPFTRLSLAYEWNE
jgi:hypothetical protein